MALGVLAYPNLKDEDYRVIQRFRKENDGLYYLVVEPHFSFVFPVENFKKEKFINEIAGKAKGIKPVEFEMRCAAVNKDAVSDWFHLLLVPDNGYSSMVKLHDRLYSGILFNELRLDIDFIPHMGIANSRDRYQVKEWADKWNADDFKISGTMDTLTVIDYSNHTVTDLETFRLE